MVSRNLTEVFVLMRNNAVHSRQIFSEQGGDSENVRLMHRWSEDVEGASTGLRVETHAPPPWADTLEEAQYVITRLRGKLEQLLRRQWEHSSRPALEEAAAQTQVARAAADVGHLLAHAHRLLANVRAHRARGTKMEQKLTENVTLALVTTLQEISVQFRTAQSNYLKSLTSREERSNAYFESPNFEELSLGDESDLLPGLTDNQTDFLFSFGPSSSNRVSTSAFVHENNDEKQESQISAQKQLLLIQEENTNMVAEREKEVNQIVRSIVDLNDIFKDLANMVNEQGTVLDRIDYNVEQSQMQVQQGYQQLQKAERYQRKNRKMHCIFILCITIIISVILLIVIKS